MKEHPYFAAHGSAPYNPACPKNMQMQELRWVSRQQDTPTTTVATATLPKLNASFFWALQGVTLATDFLFLSGLNCMLHLSLNAPVSLLEWSSLLSIFTLLSFCVRWYNIQEGRYSLGKGLIIALGLMLSQFAFFPAMPGMMPVLAAAACLTATLMMSLFHYQVFRPFSPLAPSSPFHQLELGLKRGADAFFSGLALIISLPFTLILMALIRLESEGSPLYVQTRIGLNEQPFPILKFRSMRRDAEKTLLTLVKPKQAGATVLFKMENDPRVTPLGRLLRKSSLDELPQLWNIFRGEMSLVGPRPPIVSEFVQMNAQQRRKFDVIPGLTGLWQIQGRIRNERDFDSVARDDVTYINQWCLMEDLRILVLTVPMVLLQRGAC
jgi:lipopolysaccharide/colanic/teichoic acid biosynthesis glycosyltransferase